MTYRQLYLKYKNYALQSNKEVTAIKLLIQELSNFSNSQFYLNFDEIIEKPILKKILDAIDAYLDKDIPIQYILGYTYFYGYKLIVNKNVLIPRRETEELIDWIINNNPFSYANILDIGTGSGAIAICLKGGITNSKVTAVDISAKALEVAKQNSIINNQDINFFQSDVFSNVEGKFNIIAANPPYIENLDNVADLVIKNEPHLALIAEDGGLYFYKKILKEANEYLEHESLIVFEIPEDKDEELSKIVSFYYPDSQYEIKKDLQGKSRILIIKNNWR